MVSRISLKLKNHLKGISSNRMRDIKVSEFIVNSQVLTAPVLKCSNYG